MGRGVCGWWTGGGQLWWRGMGRVSGWWEGVCVVGRQVVGSCGGEGSTWLVCRDGGCV